MRPGSFDYQAPRSSREAAELLADSSSVVIAGGQTLVPQLIRREVEPARLVDINRIDELKHVTAAADGRTQVGALVRHAEIERSADLRSSWPLLADACGHVSNPVIRRRGTIGGSVAWSSGRSEVVAALLAYDAELVVCSRASGVRLVSVADALDRVPGRVREDELIVHVLLTPGADARQSWGVAEFSTRRWDPALGGAVCRIDRKPKTGELGCVRVVAFGNVDRPRRLEVVEAGVAEDVDSETVRAQAAAAVRPFVADGPASAPEHVTAVIADATVGAILQARNGGSARDGV